MKTVTNLLLLAVSVTCMYACSKTDINTPPAGIINDQDLQTGDVTLRDLSSFMLPRSDDYAAIPQDPNNPLTAEKIELGRLLFHESRLGTTPRQTTGQNTYSCASCHYAEAGFQSKIAQGIGEGGIGFGLNGEARVANPLYTLSKVDVQPIRTPTVLNSAYQEVMLWNGQMGSTGVNAGTQAVWTPVNGSDNNWLGLQGVETVSMGAIKKHRLTPDTAWLAAEPTYNNLFELAFPDVPANQRFSTLNTALAIAAYQRSLLPNQSPFQRWLQGDPRAMNQDELAGMNIFFGKAKCSKCHYGPALNSNQFFGLGMKDLENGVGGAFNCTPNNFESKGRGGFTGKAAELYKFKVPQLYNLKDAQFLGHGSSFTSIEAVVRYKNAGISQNATVPASQLAKQFVPLHLTEDEISKLVIFLRDALYDPNLTRYSPDALPSGNCIPNNDAQSKTDRGCQ